MRRFLRVLTLVTAALALLVVTAPFMPWSTRLLLAGVARFSPLEIDYGSGSLAGELHIVRLAMAGDNLMLELDDLRTELVPACFWRSALCFRQLHAGSLALELLPSSDNEEAPADDVETGDAGLFSIPVRIEAEQLSVQSTRVAWSDGEWRQGPMLARVEVGGPHVDVIEATVSDAYLELREGDIPPPTSAMVELPDIELPLDLAVDHLLVQQLQLNVYGQAQVLQSVELQGDWRKARLRLASARIEAAPWGSLTLDGQVRLQQTWPLDLNAALLLDEPAGWDALHGRKLALYAGGSLADLTVDAVSEGDQTFTVSGQLNALDRTLPFTAAVEAMWREPLLLSSLVDTPPPLADIMLHSPLAATFSGTLQEQAVELTAAARGLGYSEMSLDLLARHREGQLSIARLALRDPQGNNALDGNGSLSLISPYEGTLSLRSPGFDLPEVGEYASGRLAGAVAVSAAVSDTAWWVAVRDADLQGEVNALPAHITGFAGLDSDLALAPSNLQAEVNRARLSLQATGESGKSGRLNMRIDDLGLWLPGNRGQFELTASLGELDGDVDLVGSLRGLGLSGIEVATGQVSGRYRPQENDAFSLEVSLAEASLGELALGTVFLGVEGTADRQALSLEMTGDLEGEVKLAGTPVGDDWRGTMAPAVILASGDAWLLDDAVDLAWSRKAQEVTLAGHCWRQGRTRICPGKLQLGERGMASLEIEGDLSFLAGFYPEEMEVQGSLDLNVSAAWTPDGPLVLEGHSNSRNVRITRNFGGGEQATIAWDRADAILEQRAEGLYLEGAVEREGIRVIALELLLPPDTGTGELSGEVRLDDLRLAALAPLMPRLAELQGTLSGSVALGGTLASPVANGSVSLRDGRVGVVGNPTPLESLDMTLQLAGDRGSLTGTGLLGGGPVALDGQLSLRPGLRLEMKVTGERHRLLLPPGTEMLISESLLLVVEGNLLDISGDIVVHEGQLEYERLPEGSVAVSGDVVIVDYAGNVLREEQPFDTRLDIRVTMRDRFEVAVGGLRATVGGDLQVRQSRGQPVQLFGSLNVIGGELTAYRQRLLIQRGTIAFTGRVDNPELNVRAEREIRSENVSVGVELLGTLEAPQMRVYSDPAMSQSEAMSYLIRGRGMDAGAGLDGAALALSMGADLVNSSGVLSGFERLPGISQIRLGAEGTADDTAATVSGYVGERLYVAYGIGLYEPITVLTARLYLSARLWLEVVSRLENSLDLYYSFDIR